MRSPAFCRRMPSAKWLRHEFPVHRIRTKGFSCILLSGPTFSVTISPRSISKLNVPNRIWGLFHDSSNASVPPPCEAYRPRHSRPKTDVAVPFFANFRQIIGPYIGRATSVGAEWSAETTAINHFKRPRNESGIVDRYAGKRFRRYHSHFLTADLPTIQTTQKFLTRAYTSIIAEQ